jgi:hypothetical protein
MRSGSCRATPLSRAAVVVTALCVGPGAAGHAIAQTTPKLAYHVPAADSVRVLRDQPYRSAAGPLRYDLYLPGTTPPERMPVVVVFNGGRGDARGIGINVGWARLLAANGFAAVTYESDTSGAVSNYDALARALAARPVADKLDLDRVALWAGSANVSGALPLASDSMRRAIRSAVMYYGAARVPSFRIDLPIQLVRVGLDQPGLLRMQDTLIMQAITANAPIEIVNHPSGEHPFEEAASRAGARIVEGSVAFLRRTLAPEFIGALAQEALRAEAGAASYNGNWARAARAFESLTERAPNDFELQRKLADSRLAAGDAAGAISAYLRSRELGHWRRGDIAIGLIVAYTQAGRREQAFTEIANLPAQWDKAAILRNNPMLAPYRNDPEFVQRMR